MLLPCSPCLKEAPCHHSSPHLQVPVAQCTGDCKLAVEILSFPVHAGEEATRCLHSTPLVRAQGPVVARQIDSSALTGQDHPRVASIGNEQSPAQIQRAEASLHNVEKQSETHVVLSTEGGVPCWLSTHAQGAKGHVHRLALSPAQQQCRNRCRSAFHVPPFAIASHAIAGVCGCTIGRHLTVVPLELTSAH